jgi:hypothetical protein
MEEPARSDAGDSGGFCAGLYTARDRAYQWRFIRWLAAAALAYVGATAALRFRASLPAALPFLLVALAIGLSAQATRIYVLFLRGADELLRRIETEALALGFGVGVAFSVLYPLLARLGAPPLDGHWSALVMFVTWAAGSWIGTRRYSGKNSA